MFYIYMISCLTNGKIYIGQTNDLKRRWGQHKRSVVDNPTPQLISKAMIKHKLENFVFEVIATTRTREDLDWLETEIIKQYDSTDTDIGYNIESGGGYIVRNDRIKKLISEGLLRYYETHEHHGKGKPLSEEWKKAISEASMGKAGTNLGKEFDQEWKNNMSKSSFNKPKGSRRRFSEEQELEICKLYESGQSTYKLGQDLNCSRTTIHDILVRRNIEIKKSNYNKHENGCRIFTDEEEIKICEEFKSMSRCDLAKKYRCGRTTIRDILLRHPEINKKL